MQQPKEPKTLKPEDFIELRIVKGSVLRDEIWKKNKDLILDERENMVEMELLPSLCPDCMYAIGIYPDNESFGFAEEFIMEHPAAPDCLYWDLEFNSALSGEIRARGSEETRAERAAAMSAYWKNEFDKHSKDANPKAR